MSDAPYDTDDSDGTDDSADPRYEPAHPSLDRLADLAEGLVESSEKARLRAHVEACDVCTEAVGALHSLPTILARAADAPLPIPQDVSIRVNAALVREAGERRTAEHPAVTVGSRRRSSVSSWRLRVAGVMVAAAVVGGGFFLTNGLFSGQQGGIVAGQPGSTTHLGTTAITAAPFGTATPPATDGTSESSASALLTGQVLAVVAAGAQADGNGAARTAGPGIVGVAPEDGEFTIQRLPSCAEAVQAALRQSGAQIGDLVGTATTTYHGAPAVLVVFHTTGTAAKTGGPFDAYIVSASCVATSSVAAPQATILAHVRVTS